MTQMTQIGPDKNQRWNPQITQIAPTPDPRPPTP